MELFGHDFCSEHEKISVNSGVIVLKEITCQDSYKHADLIYNNVFQHALAGPYIITQTHMSFQ